MKKYLLLGLLIAVLPLPLIAQTVRNPQASCMQAAIKKRDQSFVKNFNDYNKSVTDALKKRSDAESQAWTLEDSGLRQQAIDVSHSGFDSMYSLLSYQFYLTRQATHSTFSVDQEICRRTTSSSSSSRSSLY